MRPILWQKTPDGGQLRIVLTAEGYKTQYLPPEHAFSRAWITSSSSESEASAREVAETLFHHLRETEPL